MVWLPVGAPHNVLKAVKPSSKWSEWADGAGLGTAPHKQRPQEYACVINKDFRDTSSNIQYKKGMQGRLLEEKSNDQGVRLARVFIQGVTEGKGFTNRIIPRMNIDKGPPWRDDINDWEVKVNLIPETVEVQAWETPGLQNTTMLGRTIARLTTCFRDSPADFMEEDTPKLINKIGIVNFTNIIIDGIKRAGLYTVLARPSGDFTKEELINAAKYTIDRGSKTNACGIYARFHQTGSYAPRWTSDTSYVYVGKSVDMYDRYISHTHAKKTSYSELTRNSKYSMIAICVLPPNTKDGLYFLAEQVLVCLLQTYRQIVYTHKTSQLHNISLYMAAKYFIGVSDETFRLTGWRGAVHRSSFGIQEGANFSSPLLEYSRHSAKQMFIRTDSTIKDVTNGQSIPIAIFRRSTSRTVTMATEKNRSTAFWRRSDDKVVISFSYNFDRADGAFAPLPGTPYYVVIEVYKEGTPHPHSWTRLCEIGRFKNWDQARSFAVRLEWEHPPNSGKWRAKYIHAGGSRGGDILDKADGAKNIPGALEYYAKGISFLQWLFGATPNHNHSWIAKYIGSARVIQAKYDFMHQRIDFNPPEEKIQMLPGDVRSDQEIIAQREDPKHGLDNVNGEFGKFTGTRVRTEGVRKKCDFCALIGSNNTTLDRGACRQIGNRRVCTNCEHLGRPCCSWTRSIKWPRNPEARAQMTPEETAAQIAAFSALYCRPVSKSGSVVTSSTHVLGTFPTSGSQEEDDGSGAESEGELEDEGVDEDEDESEDE
jgi:hypothetical protein